MWDHWLFSMDKDGRYVFPMDPLLFHSIKSPLISRVSSFIDDSNQQSGGFHAPGGVAFQEAVSRMSKLAGGLLFWFTRTSSSNLRRLISGDHNLSVTGDRDSVIDHSSSPCLHQFDAGLETGTSPLFVSGNISRVITRLLVREPEKLNSLSFLSLAAALVPPIDNKSLKALSLSLGNGEAQLQESPDQKPCEVERHGCTGCSFPELSYTTNAVEPRTGFPLTLEKIWARQSKSSLASEVLVGTGSRTMKIIKIKSLKVYTFGFYVHPNSVCQKLGPKYASFPVNELDKCHEFFRDLLREDIGMTLRLVINCNGMKISTVRDAFEKSLRARLLKTNPQTDFSCLRTFGSFFTKDIPIAAGTTVEFRRTADGKLITEIAGNQIGVVNSKELCTAFFDMYIGDVPVSEQTKQEIGKNVASIIRKC